MVVRSMPRGLLLLSKQRVDLLNVNVFMINSFICTDLLINLLHFLKRQNSVTNDAPNILARAVNLLSASKVSVRHILKSFECYLATCHLIIFFYKNTVHIKTKTMYGKVSNYVQIHKNSVNLHQNLKLLLRFFR